MPTNGQTSMLHRKLEEVAQNRLPHLIISVAHCYFTTDQKWLLDVFFHSFHSFFKVVAEVETNGAAVARRPPH